ncbi:MAG: hypothetical protein LBS51_02205 [Oscillospiraceae bacterium]|nr:hypothetical protein [Oscillospiraceae bacterium]
MGGKICNVCLDRIEKDLTLIRDYLDSDQKSRTIEDVERRTGVSKEIIIHLLKEGRISIDDPSGGTLCCGLCGKAISTGRFCEACKNKFVEKIDNLTPPLAEVKKKPEVRRQEARRSKMHIAAKMRDDGK